MLMRETTWSQIWSSSCAWWSKNSIKFKVRMQFRTWRVNNLLLWFLKETKHLLKVFESIWGWRSENFHWGLCEDGFNAELQVSEFSIKTRNYLGDEFCGPNYLSYIQFCDAWQLSSSAWVQLIELLCMVWQKIWASKSMRSYIATPSVESHSQADFLYLLEVLFIPVLDWNPFSDTSWARVIGDSFVFDTIRVYIPSEDLHT